jgi:hypothetical protein
VKPFRILWLLLLPALLFFGSSCAVLQKSPPAPAPDASWKGIGGQVLYRDAKRSIVADVSLRQGRNSREYSLEVSKAGLVLLKLDRAESLGWAKGPLARRSFAGPVTSAPEHLQGWFTETTVALENQTPKPAASALGIQYRLNR